LHLKLDEGLAGHTYECQILIAAKKNSGQQGCEPAFPWRSRNSRVARPPSM